MSELKSVAGRIICSVNLEGKNSHTFSDGTVIRLERQFDNFNNREVRPVNAIVIDSEHIPEGAEMLISHNCTHEINQIFDYKPLSGVGIASDIKYYSLPESECFLWRANGGEWQPIRPYETALRVFRPYKGELYGIANQQLKDILYVTSGELKGVVVKTLKACDYCIVFQGSNGQASEIIRFRPFGDDNAKMEAEAIAILHELTGQVKNGELLVGIFPNDCKKA